MISFIKNYPNYSQAWSHEMFTLQKSLRSLLQKFNQKIAVKMNFFRDEPFFMMNGYKTVLYLDNIDNINNCLLLAFENFTFLKIRQN